MQNWYLIKTKPRQEKTAIVNLENQNFHVFCPFATINNKKIILFPGYIFIQLDNKTQNWSPINSTKGVSNFVKFGLSFAKVPDSIIEFIKANESVNKEKLKKFNNFKSGDKVQITDGLFKNYVAIFKSYKANDRVTLLMNILGQQQTLNLKQDFLIGL